ncbi:hypothetical protein HDV01_007567 [Terramyces sp. JEL0728]|nr:hypothetical protein HDV01_007567 [Terramyces sp. JEL0728]
MEFEILIRQEPTKARASDGIDKPLIDSFIDPMLVLEAKFNKEISKEEMQKLNVGCFVTLLNSRKETRQNFKFLDVNYSYHLYENLIGERLIKGMLLTDPVDGRVKLFFAFNNLSIRLSGEYMFQIRVIDLET